MGEDTDRKLNSSHELGFSRFSTRQYTLGTRKASAFSFQGELSEEGSSRRDSTFLRVACFPLTYPCAEGR